MDLARDAAQLLDVPLHPRLAHPQRIPADLGEEEKHVSVEMLATSERPPTDLLVPVREADRPVCIKSVGKEGKIANQVECIFVLLQLRLPRGLDVLEVHQRHCEVQGHVAVVNLVAVENVRERHADEAVVVPVCELLEDPELCYQLVEVVGEKRTLIGVCVLDEERIVVHGHCPICNRARISYRHRVVIRLAGRAANTAATSLVRSGGRLGAAGLVAAAAAAAAQARRRGRVA
mmetsp:Transcript_13958/g.39734  ORF Transcript_13958/g.39734 Transcript_13958/m.39734 type:complete len:233 (-) Transcript_13958:48-746(-)